LLPADFISVAEDSGHIIEMGHWVVEAAIWQLCQWLTQFPDTPFQLHVNLSPVEVRWPGVAEFISEALDEHGIDPQRLALEISETGLMTGDVVGLEALMTLRRLGVGVEIDDFGTGYSSISYLRRLPIDTVKVDQSLVRDIATDGQQVGFVSAILRLIESVGLRAVAEGIETAEQRDQLRHLGCLYGQGHFFSEPVPADQLTQLLFEQHAAAEHQPPPSR
jgi:EAL domain-containing protein (putative c-di-GMP-specific phosphodiesterase class I)